MAVVAPSSPAGERSALTSFTKLPCDEAAVLAAPASAARAPAAAPWILAATVLASSMAFLDGTVVNIALPTLQREFDATVFDAQWVIESFALFLSALLLVGGAAGDRFGRRRVFANQRHLAVPSRERAWGDGCSCCPDASNVIDADAKRVVTAADSEP